MAQLPDPLQHRQAAHRIETLFLRRWSPRAMNGENVAAEALARLFEAARWAPSSFNEQEWRFRYAHRGTPHWATFFSLLAESNQVWCKDAGVLIAIFAKKTFTKNGKTNPVHRFDCGCAFENLALQGSAMGLVVHGMQGFDWERTPKDLRAPADFEIAAMCAVGHPGDPDKLPPELREREVPSGRRSIEETAGEGPFAA